MYVVSLLLALLIVWDFAKPLDSHPIWFYLGALLLDGIAVAGAALGFSGPFWWFIDKLVGKGQLSFFMFALVMFAGVFPVGSRPRLKLVRVRKPASLMAAILVCGHLVAKGLAHQATPSFAGAGFYVVEVGAALLLAVLAITATSPVRERMPHAVWVNVHKAAYPFFILLCAHVAWARFICLDWIAGTLVAAIAALYVIFRVRFQMTSR